MPKSARAEGAAQAQRTSAPATATLTMPARISAPAPAGAHDGPSNSRAAHERDVPVGEEAPIRAAGKQVALALAVEPKPPLDLHVEAGV